MIKTPDKMTAKQRELVDAFVTALGDEAEFFEGELSFEGHRVTLAERGEAPQEFSYKEFAEFTEGLGENVTIIEEVDHGGQAPAAAPAEEDPKAERAEVENLLFEAVHDLVDDVRREREGQISANASRFAKGYRVNLLEQVAARLAELGDRDLGTPKAVMAFARDRLSKELAEAGIIEKGDRLNKSEVSIVRKAYRAFADAAGPEAAFELVDQLDPQSGQPLVGDHGRPYRRRLSEVPVNKLYALADYVTAENRERLASFAWAYAENTCRALAKVFKAELPESREEWTPERVSETVAGVLGEVYALPAAAQTEDGQTVAIQPDDKAVRKWAGQQAASAAEFANIGVDKAFAEGDWAELKQVASQIWQYIGGPLDKRGLIGNTVLLERMADFFVPRKHGAANLVQLFVNSGDMSESQAEQFLAEYEE